MMKKLLLLALGALFAAAPAGAVSISFAPASIDTAVGQQIAFDVIVSDLGSDSVGSYDLDLSFDPSRLAFDSFEFGALLGGPGSSLQSAGAAGAIADLAEVSLLLPDELDALQGDSAVLGTVRFDVIGTGASEVTVSQALVGDGVGRRLTVASTGSVRVDAAIPEPGAALLFGAGLVAIASGRRARRLR